jgi:hypothetical protein
MVWIDWLVGTIDISQYRLIFGFFLLYTERVPFELLEGRAAVEGENSISKFDHHYINDSVVDNT